MTDTTKAGELIIQIIADTSKLDKGVKTADKEIKSLSGATDKAKKSAADMQIQMDNTGKTAANEAQQIDTLTRSTDEASDATEEASISDEQLLRALKKLVFEGLKPAKEESDKAGDAVKKEGDEADKAASKNLKNKGALENMKDAANAARSVLGKLNSVLGVIGITVGISQLVEMIKEMAEAAKEARENLDEMNQSTKFKYGLTEAQTKIAHETASKIGALGIGMDTAKLQEITSALIHEYPDIVKNEEQFLKISKEFAGFAKVEGIEDVAGFMATFFKTCAKYQISIDEFDTFLADLLATSQKATNMRPDELLKLMQSNDKLQAYAGMNYSEILHLMGASTTGSKVAESESIQSLGSTLEQIANMLRPTIIENTRKIEAGSMYNEWEKKTFPRLNKDNAYDILVKEGIDDSQANEIAEYLAKNTIEQYKKTQKEYNDLVKTKTEQFASEIDPNDLGIDMDKIITDILIKCFELNDEGKIQNELNKYGVKPTAAAEIAKAVCAGMEEPTFNEDVKKAAADFGNRIFEYALENATPKDKEQNLKNIQAEYDANSPQAEWGVQKTRRELEITKETGNPYLGYWGTLLEGWNAALAGPLFGVGYKGENDIVGYYDKDGNYYDKDEYLRQLSTPVQSIADTSKSTGENISTWGDKINKLDNLDKLNKLDNLDSINATLKIPVTTTNNITTNITTAQPVDSYLAQQASHSISDEWNKIKGGTY